MKIQSGVRFDKMVWLEFKQLCRKEGFKVNEILERFMRTCLDERTTQLWSRLKDRKEDPEVKPIRFLNLLRRLRGHIETVKQSPDQPTFTDWLTDTICNVKKTMPDITDKSLLKEARKLLINGEKLLRAPTNFREE